MSSARNFFTTFREDHELMHLRDIQKLEGVLSPTHLKVSFYLKSYVTLRASSCFLDNHSSTVFFFFFE